MATREYLETIVINRGNFSASYDTHAYRLAHLHNVVKRTAFDVDGSIDATALASGVASSINSAKMFHFAGSGASSNSYAADIVTLAESLTSRERGGIATMLRAGNLALSEVNDHFVDNPNIEAIEVTLAFIEYSEYDIRFVTDSTITIRRAMINGVWVQ